MHETRCRVRYAETDQMGVVYYANYYVWMEIGRVELVRALGIDYHDMERTDGLLLSVVESQCRYLAPARYDQEIIIGTEIASSNARLVEFRYEISDAYGVMRLMSARAAIAALSNFNTVWTLTMQHHYISRLNEGLRYYVVHSVTTQSAVLDPNP